MRKHICLIGLLATSVCFADVLMPSGVDDTAAIQTAIDNAPEGGTVTLGDGLFILTDEILVARHVTVKSEHGRDFTQIKQTAGSSTNMFRALHINHPQAIVDGFAICNSGAQKLSSNDKGYIPGAGVYVDVQGGRLVSCIISNCNALTLGSVNLASSVAVMSNCIIRANVSTPNRALNYNTTAGLEMSAGLVTHCTIDNNVMQKGNYGSCLGAGACLKGGRLSYCFVTNNSITVSKSEGSRGGGVYVSSGSPIVDNCLISGNATQKEGGGVYAAAVGYFTNCTIVANTAKGGSGGIHVAANKAPVFYGCIIQDNVNASGYSDVSPAKASFPCSVTDGGVEFDGGGYVPVFGSAAIDACPVADYAKDMSGAIDLAGRPRLSGGAVDAGAFEYQYPDFIASVSFLSESVLPPGDTFSFTGKVVCTDASLVRYGWSIDGEDAEWTANALYNVSDLPSGIHTLTLSTRYDGVDKGEAGTLEFLVTYPDVYVVDPKLHPGHVAVYPFNLEGGAATSLVEAVACARRGTTVHVGPGVHDIDASLELVGAVKLVSTGGRDQTVIRQKTTGGTNNRCVYLNDAGAVLDGFALTGGNGSDYGTAACIDTLGGTIRNCIATNNWTGANGGTIAVLSADGLVSNCVIRLNVAKNVGPVGMYVSNGRVVWCDISCNTNSAGSAFGGNCGTGVYLTGGLLSYCTICQNCSLKDTTNGAGTKGGGLYVAKTSVPAVVENCLIAENWALREGGGVWANAGAFTNCTVACNHSTLFAGGMAVSSSVKMYGCIVQDNVNGSGYGDISGTPGSSEHCVTDGSVTFEDDYVPAFGSAAIDACPVADYAKDMSGAIDLAGRPRLSGGAVDAGAFEYQYPDFIASVSFLSESVLPTGDTFSFTGKVVCTDASLVRYGWSIDGGDAEWNANAVYSVSDLPAGVHTLTLSTRYDGVDKGEAGTLEFLVTYPDVYVVDPKLHPGHVAVYPFNLEGGAATSLVEAVACARRGTTVHVGPGVHDIDVPLELVGAVKLVSAGGREATVIRQVATGGTQNRCVHLNDEGALLDGFALTGAKGTPYGIAACIDVNGGVIRNCIATNNQTGASGGTLAVLSANGVISNCVVRWNRAMSGNESTGPVGLYMSNGLVADCDFSCNTNSTGFVYGGNSGVGARVAGGRLTRCTVCDNASTKATNNGAGGKGAGVMISGVSAVVDNCLIARNYTIESRGGVAFDAAGALLNCTVVDNVVPSTDVIAKSAGVFTDKNSKGRVVNTLIQGNVTTEGVASECTLNRALVYTQSLCATGLPDGNVSDAAVFKGEGDYHLDRKSPGVRVGRVTGYEDYLVGGVDLDGNRRATSRGKTDVGCYQSNIGLMLFVK